jgi:hypothetical protein
VLYRHTQFTDCRKFMYLWQYQQTRTQISRWRMKTPEFCHTSYIKAYASTVEMKVNMWNEITNLRFVILQWSAFTLTFHAQRKPQGIDSPVNRDKSLSTWKKKKNLNTNSIGHIILVPYLTTVRTKRY